MIFVEFKGKQPRKCAHFDYFLGCDHLFIESDESLDRLISSEGFSRFDGLGEVGEELAASLK